MENKSQSDKLSFHPSNAFHNDSLTSTPYADFFTRKGLNSAPNGIFWSGKGLTSTPYGSLKSFICLRFCCQLLLVDLKSWMRENSNREMNRDLFSKASNSEVRLQPQILMWRPQSLDQYRKFSVEAPILGPESLNITSLLNSFLWAKVNILPLPTLRKMLVLKNYAKS